MLSLHLESPQGWSMHPALPLKWGPFPVGVLKEILEAQELEKVNHTIPLTPL